MTLVMITDELGKPVSIEAVPAAARQEIEALGYTIVSGFETTADGPEPRVFARDDKAEAAAIMGAAERITGYGRLDGPLPQWADDLLYGDGHPVRRGLLSSQAPEPPTESTSRQRRRWLARHPGRRT